jgi:dihydroorotate dehydrogenase
MYKSFIKPVLFLFDPEWVHHTVFATLKAVNRIPGMGSLIRTFYQVKDKRLERKLFGQRVLIRMQNSSKSSLILDLDLLK